MESHVGARAAVDFDPGRRLCGLCRPARRVLGLRFYADHVPGQPGHARRPRCHRQTQRRVSRCQGQGCGASATHRYRAAAACRRSGSSGQARRAPSDATANHGEEFRDAKPRAAAQALRIGPEPPQLAADLEAAAKEAGIQIPETADRPDSAAGKRYIEHSLDVKLRKVDLKSLATFLSKVETGRSLVLITRLQIRRSFGGDGTSVDVDLTATTYERIKDGSKKPPLKGAAAGKGKG